MTVQGDLHLFVEEWAEEPVEVATPPRPLRCVLVFASDAGRREAIRRRLVEDEPDLVVVTVARGTEFRRRGDDHYEVGGDLGEAYRTLLRTVAGEHGQLGAVVHLWATEDAGLLWEPEPLAVLLQSMIREDVRPGRVLLGGAYHDDVERCAVESWLGYERSTSIVMPGTDVTVLCLDAASSDGLVDTVASDLRADRPASARHTGGRRYVLRVRAAEPGPATGDLVRHNGTYLITGGMGGLGAIFATWLARDYAAHLVLLGRRPHDDTVARRIAELEAAGGTAMYCQADVCDAAALSGAIETALDRFGRIDGVLHTAGVQRRGNIADRDLETFTGILAPKITGTINLENALAASRPDFVCYFSSSAAVLGDFGSCDYACGNRFQLSYAEYLARGEPDGPKRLAVCWPLWDSDGMGLADDAATEFYVRSSGQRLLRAGEGTALLRDLLTRPGAHYLALAGNSARIHAMLSVDAEPSSVSEQLDAALREMVSRILRIPVERLPVDENFQDFGFDSLSLVEFAGHVAERLGVEFTPDLLFSYTTLQGVHGFLLGRYGDVLAGVFGSPVSSGPVAEPEGKPVVRRRTRRAAGNRFAAPRQDEPESVVEPVADEGSVSERLDVALREMVSRILRIPVERLPVDENFQDFGFDSLSLVEFAGHVAERLGVEFTPDLLFSYTTLQGVHGFLLGRYGDVLAGVFGSPVSPGPVVAEDKPVVRRRTRRAGNRFAASGQTGPAAPRSGEPIAIIGMSGRFASAGTVDGLWELLSEGRSAIGAVPDERDPSWADGKERRLGWLPGIAEFDPRFFGIAPSEAETIDPRQRLLMEEMWKALEDAGFGPEQLGDERVGVFVGVEEGDYRLLAAAEEAITANHNAVLAARLSYFLNLTGPGIAINTACSSSLVALHEACLSLRHGDCDTAIVAGANLMATPREYDAMDGAGMLSPTGVCRAFDRRADGMVPGEAVVAVVLKARDRAERDRHPVHACVLGTAVNNDGRTNGITAPSGLAQTRLLTDVYGGAGVSPASVSHIVAHGTGTRLGDPVEINALAEAFGQRVSEPGSCALTSTKPNVGHSQAASGLVSVVAMALAMKNETIPPSIRCEEISDFVPWARSPFFVNREARPWPEPRAGRRYGGVSAFGFSGTNAHAVLESHGTARQDLERLGAQPTSPSHLLVCSARTEQALAKQLRELADRLESLSDTGSGVMSSVSYTLMAGRHHFARRCALVVRDREEAVTALREAADGAERFGIAHGTVPRDYSADAAEVAGVRDLATLGRFYCQGHDPALFAGLWGERPPERMSLPTYPFDNAEYWVQARAPEAGPAAPSWLHPLVHRNISDITGLRFASEFTGTERWFVDGTMTRGAQLDLVVAAVARGLGGGPVTVHDIECHDAITAAGAGCSVRVDLGAVDERTVDWALYASDDTADRPHLVADGRASRASDEPHLGTLDLPALKASDATILVELDVGADATLFGAHVDTCLAVVCEDGAVAASFGETFFGATAGQVRWAHLTPEPGGSVDIELAAEDGTVVVYLRDVTVTGRQAEIVAAPAAPPGKGRRVNMRGWTVAECLAWDLADSAGKVLKISADQLDPEENLANFGFNSLNVAAYATELSTRLDIRITPDTFFNHPTLTRLADHFLAERAESISAWYHEGSAASTTAAPPARSDRRYQSDRFDTDTGPLTGAAPAEPIAIVGMSGRFPESRSVDGLWSILVEGRSAIREVPEERVPWWRTDAPADQDRARRFGAVPGVSEFDPLFFEISPREAELMDPRQRLLLQEMWNALEDAGYGDRATDGGKVGIFVGVEEGDYRYLVDSTEGVTTTNNSMLAARLAYFLNLVGPSMAINTSCSSGLVALHEACLSLRYGDCDTAIVAGASVLSSAHDYVKMEKAGMLSPDRTCYAFDKRANGMVPGEAIAVVVLKKKRAAQRDGSRIYATVLGSGINYDGRTNGITAPNGDAQSRLLRSVYDRYGIAPDSIDYVAAHGTGTRLGDPIEINALADAFRARTDRTGFCALTSIKPNVGHSMAASGLVSLIGVAMAMRNEAIPPSIHCEELSDYIDWDASPFFVNREARAWPASAERPRRGAVSSFGVSGTNAHVVLEAPGTEQPDQDRPPLPHHLLVVSAKTEEALVRRLTGLADHLEAGDGDTAYLESVCRTLMTGRHHFAQRCALVVRDRDDAVRLLRVAATGAKEPRLCRATVSRDFVANGTIEKTIAGIARSCATSHDDGDTCREHLRALAEFYCQGYTPAFEGLWETLPCLVSLPNYPFAVEHHWPSAVPAPGRSRPLHPLVHEHSSDGTVHRFRTHFTGDEAVLSDLLVPAQTVRPAATR